MSTNQVALDKNHPFMVAWKEYTASPEFANSMKWALSQKYDDGREISAEMHNSHVEGALWLAFTKGFELAERLVTDVTAKEE